MNKAIVLETQCGDWQGLFINGKLVYEGHTLEDGEKFASYWGRIAREYNIDLEQVKYLELNNEDEEDTLACGGFPQDIFELKGDYISA